jgi:beta-galactosidase
MQKQNFNTDWLFFLGDPGERLWRAPDGADWRRLDLPHDWSIELERTPDAPSTASGGFFPMGRAWYAKTFDAPETWRGQTVLVEFEGVYMNAEVWLNEHFLGRHPYGYTSFTINLTPFLRVGEQNTLRVMVDNAAQMNSRWYSGSGIYRPVWLWVAGPVHIAHWGVFVTTPEVSAHAALVRAETRAWNAGGSPLEVTLRTRVFDPDGAPAGEAASPQTAPPGQQAVFRQDVQVGSPGLWSPETPRLYRLVSELLVDGSVVDTLETIFGIRSIQVDAQNGFLLNGEPVKMKGGCVHHDNGVLGAASYPRSEERKVELLKASGYNAVRCAHNPPAPAFLDACDRLGMLVMDEAFDCWRTGKNPYDYHVAFDDWWQRDVASMVERDRNHPSVVMWSIGNEVYERDGRSNGAQTAHMLAEEVRALDPTRPISSAICGVWDKERTWEDTDPVFAALDIGGYNYQWRQYVPDHQRHPGRVMAGTESIPGEALENWVSVLDHSYVIGDFVWTALDYLGEAGIGRVHFEPERAGFLGEYPWHQAYCGDIDLAGFKRPQSFFRDVVWETGAPLYIAVHVPLPEDKKPVITYWGWPDVDASWTWPGRESQAFQVDVYSAAEQVELFLNGKSLGARSTSRAEKHLATFEVPYEPGQLKAVGRLAGGRLVETTLHTTGDPARIRLSPDRNRLAADPFSLSYVTVEVVDAAGRKVPNADHAIHFTVEGEGALAALGNGNPLSTESYRGSQRQAFRGRCLAVVKSNGQPGSIRLRAEAEGLEGAETVIVVE